MAGTSARSGGVSVGVVRVGAGMITLLVGPTIKSVPVTLNGSSVGVT